MSSVRKANKLALTEDNKMIAEISPKSTYTRYRDVPVCRIISLNWSRIVDLLELAIKYHVEKRKTKAYYEAWKDKAGKVTRLE